MAKFLKPPKIKAKHKKNDKKNFAIIVSIKQDIESPKNESK